jgi:hypothetical protein
MENQDYIQKFNELLNILIENIDDNSHGINIQIRLTKQFINMISGDFPDSLSDYNFQKNMCRFSNYIDFKNNIKNIKFNNYNEMNDYFESLERATKEFYEKDCNHLPQSSIDIDNLKPSLINFLKKKDTPQIS